MLVYNIAVSLRYFSGIVYSHIMGLINEACFEIKDLA